MQEKNLSQQKREVAEKITQISTNPQGTDVGDFFDAPRMLAALGFADTKGNVADFGCGYGTFTVAAARLTTATVFAFDIECEMIVATAHKA